MVIQALKCKFFPESEFPWHFHDFSQEMEFHDFSISGRFFSHFPWFPWFLPDGGLPVFNGLPYDHRCNSSFIHHLQRLMISTSLFSQTFRHNVTMPPMCRSCPDVNKLWGMDTTILGQHRPFMLIKSFVQHSGWQEMVSLCSLIRLIGVCADRDQPEFLCSRSDSGTSKSMWPQREAS